MKHPLKNMNTTQLINLPPTSLFKLGEDFYMTTREKAEGEPKILCLDLHFKTLRKIHIHTEVEQMQGILDVIVSTPLGHTTTRYQL